MTRTYPDINTIFSPVAQLEQAEYGLIWQGQSLVFSRKQLKQRKVGQTLKSPTPHEVFFFYERTVLGRIKQLFAHQQLPSNFFMMDELFELACHNKVKQNLFNAYSKWWRSIQHWSIFLMVGHTSEITITSLVQFKQFINKVADAILSQVINQLLRQYAQKPYHNDDEKIAFALRLLKKMNYEKPELWIIGTQVLRKSIQTSPKLGACLLLTELEPNILDEPLNDRLWQNLHKLCNMASRSYQGVFVRFEQISHQQNQQK